jgi:hypothetical protein
VSKESALGDLMGKRRRQWPQWMIVVPLTWVDVKGEDGVMGCI